MASAQVLKKQEQLAAGRRKLEEFRRKKALEKAKKATSTSLLYSSDGVSRSHENQPSEYERVYMKDNGVGSSDAFALDGLESSDVSGNNEKNEFNIGLKSEFSSSEYKHAISSLVNKNDVNPSNLEHSFSNDQQKDIAASSGSMEPTGSSNISLDRAGKDAPSSPVTSRFGNDCFLAHSVSPVQEVSRNSNYHGLDGYPLNMNNDSGSSAIHQVSETVHSATSIEQRLSVFPDIGESRITSSQNHSSPWIPNHRNDDFGSDTRRSSNNFLSPLPAAGRGFRPLLDSIHVSQVTLLPSPYFGEAKVDFPSPKVFQRFTTSSIDSGNAVESFNHVVERKSNFSLKKPNENFTDLEQHIEDLMQEKFSLQRGLEASRALSESLASENSSLTDSYNQQGSLVHQLKVDLEKLQDEVKLQLVELEAVKLEYANTQQECSAADERAKLLASEVIGLEEKALHLRSNELKLEMQVENYQVEISSYRKKVSSLEKECQDLNSTIDALQEEKKMLQSRLLKASSSEKSFDLKRTSSTKKDVSTSTEDLDTVMETPNSEKLVASSLPGDGESSCLLLENSLSSLESLSLTIPSDHMRIIQNINTLTAELAMEKDHLTRTLSVESSQNSTLVELKKELTRKLEAQTQRLELLAAQSMANNGVLPRRLDTRVVHENVRYADEGDEVVERVLGWIMKLFPGGPSRRTTSKRFSL